MTILRTTDLKTITSETQKGDTTATPPTSTAVTTAPTNTIETFPTTTRTTDLKTTLSESQKGENTATSPTSTILPNPATAPTVSTLSETHDDLIIQTPFQLVESVPSIGTTIAQSPETTTAHSTTLISSSSWITKSSAMTETTNVSKGTQSSSPGAGICALDEYPAIRGVCMCNDSYYAHSELSRMVVTLHCQPQKIEVALRSCFLKTHHWILRDHAFSGCSSVSKIEEGHRVQIFMIEKKEGVCGLELSTNHSHALYSLEVQLLQVLSDSAIRDATTLNFSCVYPLVVDVSQTQPYPVVIQTHAFPYSTVHVPGIGDTIVILGIFTDPQQSSPLENRPVPLGTSLYVVLRATSSDPERFTLVVNEVFASTNASRTGAVKGTYHFVKASCPVSNHLTGDLNNNGNSLEVTLAFNLIRFLTSDTIYLHGRVTLCNKLAGHRCQPTCTQKSPPAGNKARSVVQERKRGLENSSGWLMFGPIQITGNWIIVERAVCSRRPAPGRGGTPPGLRLLIGRGRADEGVVGAARSEACGQAGE
ncbi:uromodulin-like [Erinaceus europaeus]|uniref:Uromodulin-like n=1 Tax=Erinaceus europaeus TaxID=9365 RepID=A0ABM3YIN2_ERIEU|nr:uromodulin-like [Erinaceus europaeus]